MHVTFAVLLGIATIATFIWAYVSPNVRRPLFAAWCIIPPLWFAVEYFFVFDNWEDRDAVADLRYMHSLLGKLWAAFLAIWAGMFLIS